MDSITITCTNKDEETFLIAYRYKIKDTVKYMIQQGMNSTVYMSLAEARKLSIFLQGENHDSLNTASSELIPVENKIPIQLNLL